MLRLRGETLQCQESGQFSILLTSVWTVQMFGKYDLAIISKILHQQLNSFQVALAGNVYSMT